MGYVAGQQYHVYDIAIQNDGKIILVGGFHNYDNVGRNRIVRLNTDGSIDLSFDPGDAVDGTIRAVELQSDGKIVIGGSFTYYDGWPNDAPYIARLNTDGTQDNTFDPGTGANASISDVTIQDDGKILCGGDFTELNGVSRGHIARLNADGSLDNSFDPGAGTGGTFPAVRCVRVQNDNKIIASGYFDSFDGTTRGKIARLNADGSHDLSFDPGVGADLNAIHKVEILSDGDMILVGSFYQYDGVSRNSVARIDSDGGLDTGFDPGTGCNNTGEALAVQGDGKVLIGGNFGQYDGTTRNYMARIHNDVGTNGLSEVSEELVAVYPNPSNGHVNIQTGDKDAIVTIVNVQGQHILETSGDLVHINLDEGMYFIHVSFENKKITKKLQIIQ